MMERTRMFSERPGTPGRRVHMPRTIKSICTPARLASYRARMMPGSISEFILAMMRAGRPARASAVSAAMRSSSMGLRVKGL